MTVVNKVDRHGEVSVIYCRGPMVLGEVDDLDKSAAGAIEETARLVIHLGQVPYVDSTGLGLLAYLCVSARKRGGDVKLVAPSAYVEEVLDTTMLGHVFEVHPTTEAALAAFSTPRRAITGVQT